MNPGNRAWAEDRACKAGTRRAWAVGDYHRFATDTGPANGPAELDYQYVRVIARTCNR